MFQESVANVKLTLDFEVDDEIPEVRDAEVALGRLAFVAAAVVDRHVFDDQTPEKKTGGKTESIKQSL